MFDVTPELFSRIVGEAPEGQCQRYVTFVASGLRARREYLGLTPCNLNAATCCVSGRAKAALSGEGVRAYAPRWRYVEQSGALSDRLQGAATSLGDSVQEGGSKLLGYDLRHCYGQWAVNAVVPESRVTPAYQVAIYRTAELVPWRYEEGALLSSLGDQSCTRESQMYASMRKKAGQMGANGVILQQVKDASTAAQIG